MKKRGTMITTMVLVVSVAAACGGGDQTPAPIKTPVKEEPKTEPEPEPQPGEDGYALVWAEEFDYEGLPNTAYWTMETGTGWGNNEPQHYTTRAENARVSGGTLKINCLKETYNGAPYTSARLITAGKKTFTYGRFEVRAKLPRGRGTWPAIWMLGQNIMNGVEWPRCGEIDIMEHVGYDQGVIHASIHTQRRNHAIGTQVTAQTRVEDCSEEFHVYTLLWTEKSIKMAVDGKEYYNYTPTTYDEGNWPFAAPHFILLNVAFGGNWGGAMGVDESVLPQTMEVDYVRVYQLKQ